jgi:hypothetical protein
MMNLIAVFRNFANEPKHLFSAVIIIIIIIIIGSTAPGGPWPS